ncbi:uncharacterized protein LOC126749048 [Anthonomus grandis grandis]|uniref:uncharacterized protein LOC126749048 n=1 Tax=Anthonomus grandis grandis TaxID=2921223 RepID=UPI0021656717|nr:uncharacterized protein LOC126749048 [Anthonomus grandis grandis]XP_050314616.1 uncharacterized protein LOC126749048 [Anthonomus grandis grandis]
MNNLYWLLQIFICLASQVFTQNLNYSRSGDQSTFINTVRFPYSMFFDPFMGLIIAFDIKLSPSSIDADFSWNIEANYFLPQNISEYSFPPIIESDSNERGLFDRNVLYRMLESKLDSFSKNYTGHNCFLRIICEMSCFTTKDTDIFGDILHIILSPTSSEDKNISQKYIKAENYGKKNTHCDKYIKKCPVNIFGTLSVLEELLDNKLFE